MSLKKIHYTYFILFIIISFKEINNNPPHRPPPQRNHKKTHKDILEYLDDFFFNDDDFIDNNKKYRGISDYNNINTNTNMNISNETHNNKLKIINELKEKTLDISKKNDESKKKLKKYNLYYYIMITINVIFAFIILFFIFYKIYFYFNLLKKTINDSNLIISMAKSNYQITQENAKEKETKIYSYKTISKSSFVIKGGNNKPVIIIESLDKSEAPAVNTF